MSENSEPGKKFLQICGGNIARAAMENPEIRAAVIKGLMERKLILVVAKNEKEAAAYRADGHKNVITRRKLAAQIRAIGTTPSP